MSALCCSLTIKSRKSGHLHDHASKHLTVRYTKNCNWDESFTKQVHIPATRKKRKFKNIDFQWVVKENLKHICLYSHARKWAGSTAGNMFHQKLYHKKVQWWCILCVWLVLSYCVLERIYRVPFLKTVSK